MKGSKITLIVFGALSALFLAAALALILIGPQATRYL